LATPKEVLQTLLAWNPKDTEALVSSRLAGVEKSMVVKLAAECFLA
jgi:hypothetical protein